MGFWSSITSFASSVVSTVKSVASAAWKKAKEIAAKAVDWMATKAEKFVGKVKEVWEYVKPYVKKAQAVLRAAASAAPWPWLKVVLLGLDKAATFTVALAKKIEVAVKWLIALAKKINGSPTKVDLSDAELEDAERHRDTLRETLADLPATDRTNLEVASMLNDYAIASTKVTRALEDNNVADFEHYLRLRATQKLLQESRQKLDRAQAVQDITPDDRFLLIVADDLVKSNPELSEENAKRLDGILLERHGKRLVTFVFEEMIVQWEGRRMNLEKAWENTRDLYAAEKVALRRLETTKRFADGGVLDEKSQSELDRLSKVCADLEKELELRRKGELEMKIYVDAAEGFLQMQEKSPEDLEKEGHGFLVNDGPRAGEIIIACAQGERTWESLDEDEQGLLIDFANIFRNACAERVKSLVEVSV